MKNWTRFMAIAAATAAFAATAPSYAEDKYPSRQISWIVPFSAGGPTDSMARNIANQVSQRLGQSIVVENAPGAGGTIGATRAAREKPDGYTFLVGHIGYMAAAPSLYENLRYDPVKDFDAVFRFPDTPLVLLVGAKSKFKAIGELVDFARANPKALNFSNAGVGSTSHLVAAMFASKAGIEIQPIAYKGAGPALNDLMGGQVDAMFDQTNTALPQVKGGHVRALGLTSTDRMPQFPGVPAMTEAAVPGFTVATWYGLYAPKGTPREVIDTMYAAYREVMRDEAFTKSMADQGIRLLPDAEYAPAAFQAFTAEEGKRWAEVIKQAGIRLN
ncbi:tripartite tricarboxylate transporter substrate binding protein BugD [Pusillimonas sp. TS35]|uniref:Bug family tripartite tricarboxylate transporter substrate binding protein n=1 Tax=Paracandidimonas lactea TaxID=2895524 RepID=UPI00136E6EC9|nr:tripartite tricarboxylate transporter substrate-binding protein [Paracandidimonas lactea]MYN12684.1 tripartite tricarboxylate transporter substrate binding protein BugD [Pusillimonas sp. TS35]